MDTNQLKCPMCGATFNTQEEMAAHGKMHEKKEEQQAQDSLVCSKCGFKAADTNEMSKHGAQHQTA